ncbi:MAG: glutamate formimidoyltransferase [Deltaproteobacteria bacterium]|nr:glutamate formimidoyltransferase [Deltaproteobacteria bacterium]
MKLIEAVPNFSEGRDIGVISSIAAALSGCEGTKLLDIDPSRDANRTVYTLVGDPASLEVALFSGIKRAVELIDMSRHVGTHPRIGACDVCPLVPFSGVDFKDCDALAKRLGEKIWSELEVPIYYYERSAGDDKRKNLSDLRRGEYEGLSDKLKDPKWLPDVGSPIFNPKSGLTVIGARDFLIAYNVNLNGTLQQAKTIAAIIRESGRFLKDSNGRQVYDLDNKPVRREGMLKFVKAIGWYMEELQQAQVSTNILDFRKSPLVRVFHTIRQEALRLGVDVTGSELVGMIPLEALLDPGRIEELSSSQQEKKVEEIAGELGLNQLKPFNPESKILEFKLKDEKGFHET